MTCLLRIKKNDEFGHWMNGRSYELETFRIDISAKEKKNMKFDFISIYFLSL